MRASLLPCLAAIAFASLAPAQDPSRLVSGPIGERIARFVAAATAYGFTGAVLGARDGKVVAACGAGFADLDGQIANDANTLFELASVTKQFTAAAILVLVQQGKLKLDDPIADHLPDVPDDCRAITIRHLLQHTSGIPGTNGRGSGDDVAAVVKSFLAGGPQHPVGTHWEYWNQGYALLAAIVERTAGTGYQDYCRQHLFAPAGCATACFTGDKAPARVTVAIGRAWRGEPRSALAHPYGSYGFQYKGMGGAVASLWDLWHWDRALCGDTVLTAASRKELFRPGLHDYALGWFVKQRNGRLVQSHGGSVRGFLCEIRRFPAANGFLAVLCNRDDGPMGEVGNAVEDLLFGGNRELPALLPADAGAELIGAWRSERARLVIERHDDRLRVLIEWDGIAAKSRGHLAGQDLDHAAFFDWRESLPLGVERTAGKIAAVRVAGLQFRRE